MPISKRRKPAAKNRTPSGSAPKRVNRKKKIFFQPADAEMTTVILRIESLLSQIQRRKIKIIGPDLKGINKLSPDQIKRIQRMYKKTFQEFRTALKGNDEYVNESYSHFTLPSLKLATVLFSSLNAISKADKAATKKITRKRVKK